MIKTSIIIPVYNVEKYLPKCLDSVINQTLLDIEIICVNDESPDNCEQILDEYAKRDSRLIILSEKNGGQGSARNRGLEVAQGKYIQFLDSDDYYEPNCCEVMYNIMEEHSDIDVACFDSNIVYESFEDKKENDDNYFKMRYKGKTRIKPLMAHQKVDVNCWNKIFRKSFIDHHKLRFPEKLHFEDVAFFWFWVTRTKYIYFQNQKLTNYVRRKGSFMGEIYERSSKVIFEAFTVNEIIYDDLMLTNKWEEYKSAYIKSYLLKFRWLVKSFENNNLEDRKNLICICSNFLRKFNVEDFDLDSIENNIFRQLVKENYYFFNTYNNFEVESVTPVYHQSNNIVFSSDRNYIPYLSVAIYSIIENSSPDENYDIIILHRDVYYYQQRFILSLVDKKSNVSIRFFNVSSFAKKYGIDELFKVNHLSLAAYFRLFVGTICAKYEKVLYLDCDLIVTTDIAKLFHTDIGNYPIGAVLDTTISNSLIADGLDEGTWKSFRRYMRDTLDFTNQVTYFNSGVMVIDIEKFNEIGLDYLLDLARHNNKFFHDQNVFNAAFEGNYFQLGQTWNFQWNVKFHSSNYKEVLPPDILAFYEDPNIHANIIHYTSHEKPWKNPYHSFANLWWEYARKTPFYEIFLRELYERSQKSHAISRMLSDREINCIFYRYNKTKYWKYRLLSKLTFGKTRKKYKQLKRKYKDKLNSAKRFLHNFLHDS